MAKILELRNGTTVLLTVLAENKEVFSTDIPNSKVLSTWAEVEKVYPQHLFQIIPH